MTSPVDLSRHRALDHWFADGAVELALGLLLLGTSVVVLAQARFPGAPSALLLAGWVVGGTWIARRWIAATKETLVERKGYVSFAAAGRRAPSALAMATVAVAAVSAAVLLGTPTAATASAGVVLVGALFAILIRTRRRRIGLVCVVAAVAWIQAMLVSDRYPLNIAMMLAVTGLALLIMALRARLSGIDRRDGARSRA
jgi:hypothetical protein